MATALQLTDQGPGSYGSILEYVTAVIEQNTYPVHDVYPWPEMRDRLARGMLYSILHRLGAPPEVCGGQPNPTEYRAHAALAEIT